jgi:dTDP-4-dehydrorhamnose reductase
LARILITGASGLLGANLALTAVEQGHTVIGVAHAHRLRSKAFEVVQADLTRPGEAERVIADSSPDWLVHCAALTDLDACERTPELASRLNRDAARSVAAAASANHIRLVHISTDAVFDGRRGGYSEEEVPNPINAYGRSKLEGERSVADACPSAAIVRTNIYGWNALGKQSLAEWFLGNLEAGRACNGFTDVKTTPILVNDLSRLLLSVLDNGLSGTLHIAGAECLSKYEFGLKIAAIFALDPELIRPTSVDQAGLAAKRSKELCLDCRKAQAALGIRLPSVDEGLQRFRELRVAGLTDRLHELLEDSNV